MNEPSRDESSADSGSAGDAASVDTLAVEAAAAALDAAERATRPAPASLSELFFAFNNLALHGFGGVLPWAQRVLVDQKRWLTIDEFVEILAFGQLFPGPNIVNVALMVGNRYFGWRGAVTAVFGMLLFPALLVLTMAYGYLQIAYLPVVRHALDGMSAVAAGLIMGTAYKLARSQRKQWRWLGFGVASFVLVGLLHWPLLWTLVLLAPVAIAAAWRVRAR